jgi:hypothetical protein
MALLILPSSRTVWPRSALRAALTTAPLLIMSKGLTLPVSAGATAASVSSTAHVLRTTTASEGPMASFLFCPTTVAAQPGQGLVSRQWSLSVMRGGGGLCFDPLSTDDL